MKSTRTGGKNDVIGFRRSEPIILSDFLPQFYQGRVCKYVARNRLSPASIEWGGLRRIRSHRVNGITSLLGAPCFSYELVILIQKHSEHVIRILSLIA
ncbi:hypothetical protein AVEN_274207-1 [Araneus ventricosus]|uniref:Uncharacterized protein n=1 Tax=Araneus ventricosus TaxID=182803 RepID=A0A4Y2PU70_ARAVE|nr:hypothetical protein AVEN_274207-1 [Araneus ventricosus]